MRTSVTTSDVFFASTESWPDVTDRRKQMLELVQRAHEKQSRNNGRIPYWMHLLSVAQIVDWALEVSGELPDDAARDDLYLAALGHDLYEDTAVEPIDIRLQFGERVDAWIQGMTNYDGDEDRAAYLSRMATAPEEVRVLKLADLMENTASMSYAIVDMGVEWTEKTFLPIVTEMRDVLVRTHFESLRRTAALLRGLLDYNYERLRRNVEMFRLVEESRRSVTAKRSNATTAAPTQISAEAWERALERTRERERRLGERFKGRIFPIPDEDE